MMKSKELIEKQKQYFYNTPLASRLKIYYLLVIIPMALMLVVCITSMWAENRRYDELINAAGTASSFSLDFKKEFDYETYLVIVESKSFEESSLRGMLREANELVAELQGDLEINDSNVERLENVEKYLRNLNTYIDRIENNLKQGDQYEVNIEIWENDVQIVTALIRETMIQFIYYEIQDIQYMRVEMQVYYSTLIKILMLIFTLVTLLAFFMSSLVSRSIINPIRHLSRVTQKVAKGELDVRANMRDGAEIGLLGNSLDIMIDQINKLLEQVTEEQIRLRKAELELLQAQINPHFLYNTLDTIMWLAESGDQHKVVSMVASLSDFFRTTLNQGRDIVSLKDELRHVTSYLEIQQVRYQDIMDYEVSIPEELYTCMIPKITLQPLVENALYHGIKNRRGKGMIQVTGERLDGYVAIYVKDNGIGINEARLQQIHDKIENSADDDEVFGLHNVNERIRLKFGNACGIKVNSIYGEGTTVTVILPTPTQA